MRCSPVPELERLLRKEGLFIQNREIWLGRMVWLLVVDPPDNCRVEALAPQGNNDPAPFLHRSFIASWDRISQ